MKRTIDLLNEVVEMGFDREEALENIDASIDNEIGFENRKALIEELISEELYNNIKDGFIEALDGRSRAY